MLSSLPGSRSVKRRYKLPEQGRTCCIDIYEEPPTAAGILVAEIECDSDETLDAITLPAWATSEITKDAMRSGAALAK